MNITQKKQNLWANLPKFFPGHYPPLESAANGIWDTGTAEFSNDFTKPYESPKIHYLQLRDDGLLNIIPFNSEESKKDFIAKRQAEQAEQAKKILIAKSSPTKTAPIKTAYDKTKDPEQVKAMQMALKEKGFNIVVDGKWGAKTQEAYNQSLRQPMTKMASIEDIELVTPRWNPVETNKLAQIYQKSTTQKIAEKIFTDYTKEKRETKDWLKEGGEINFDLSNILKNFKKD